MTPTGRILLAVLAAALATAPTAVAPGEGEAHAYLLNNPASTLSVEVHYLDGVATTKFAFVQLQGANGGPGERLKPTPECTEWIGTFTEAAAMLGSGDAVNTSSVRVRFDGGHAPLEATGAYNGVPLDLEVVSSTPGGLTGRILTCDQPGDGLLRISLTPTVTFGRAAPSIVRIQTEGSS